MPFFGRGLGHYVTVRRLPPPKKSPAAAPPPMPTWHARSWCLQSCKGRWQRRLWEVTPFALKLASAAVSSAPACPVKFVLWRCSGG